MSIVKPYVKGYSDMYSLRCKNRIWKWGSFGFCMKELMRIFPPNATIQDVIKAGWSIKYE